MRKMSMSAEKKAAHKRKLKAARRRAAKAKKRKAATRKAVVEGQREPASSSDAPTSLMPLKD